MKKIKKIIIIALSICLLFTTNVFAGTSANYSVSKAPGIPSSYYVRQYTLSYYSGGYKAIANKLTGGYDRRVLITAPGMAQITITTTGQWSSKRVTPLAYSTTFTVTASSETNCSSDGVIRIYD